MLRAQEYRYSQAQRWGYYPSWLGGSTAFYFVESSLCRLTCYKPKVVVGHSWEASSLRLSWPGNPDAASIEIPVAPVAKVEIFTAWVQALKASFYKNNLFVYLITYLILNSQKDPYVCATNTDHVWTSKGFSVYIPTYQPWCLPIKTVNFWWHLSVDWI